jgi:two-component system phosphate regulon sensor histidine kinase PhoR
MAVDATEAVSALHAQLVETLADHLDEGLILVDDALLVRFANAAARTILNVDSTAGEPRLDAIAGDYRLSLMARACLAQRRTITRELDESSTGRQLHARAVPVKRSDAGRTEVFLVLRDESRLRHLETVRRDFVANVSHELRTPVAAIQLLVETLQNGALEEPQVAAEFVAKIGLEVAHMAQIVAELLELSAIESGARPMRSGAVPIAELVGAAERLQPLADECRVHLDFFIEPSTPPVLGDGDQLAQVVRNIVHNAIKFTPGGGSIVLSAAPAGEPSGSRVQLSIADTGCGMSAEETARIFERFYKTDRSRQRDGEGTGLGLAIARHTVEAHGGTIAVVSDVGRGSTFTVDLPAAPPTLR